MYSDLSEAAKVNFFNGFQPLTIFAKSSILVVWLWKSDCKKIGGDICLDATIQRCSQRAAFEEIQRNKVAGEQLTVELWKPFQTTIRFFAKILNGWM